MSNIKIDNERQLATFLKLVSQEAYKKSLREADDPFIEKYKANIKNDQKMYGSLDEVEEDEEDVEAAAEEEAAPVEEALSVSLEEKTSSQIINEFESKQMKTDLPEFRPGDTVVVSVKVREGERTRLQAFEGVVMGVKKAGLNSSFIVRKI